MATYTFIAGTASTATEVTFSSIPQTYDDLILHVYAHAGAGSGTEQLLQLRFNNDSTAAYFNHGLITQSPYYYAGSGATEGQVRWLPGANVGSPHMATSTIYIPRYTQTSSGCKTALVTHGNANDYQQSASLGSMRWDNSGAISTITIRTQGYAFLTGSQFYLYGIKNT